MALTKQEKSKIINDVSDLLTKSKITVVVNYQGTSVKQLHQIRLEAKKNQTTIKVIKNRLVKQAFQNTDNFKESDTNVLTDMLLYAFSENDELSPAQLLSKSAKQISTIKFVGGYLADGSFISADDVQVLANLPSKEALRSVLVGTLLAPMTNFVGVLNGNLRGLLTVLEARSNQLN